jgi:hypothetical protein
MILISLNLACAPCFGDDPTILQLNQPAPYPGLLFSQPKAKDIRNKLLERDAFKSTNESLERTISLKSDTILQLEGQKELLLKNNDQLATSLHSERTANAWTYVLYFGLGVLATGFAFYGAQHIQK